MQNKNKFFLITIIFVIIFSILLTFHFSNKIYSTLMVYAEEEANKVLSTIVNKIVLEEVTSYVNFDKLFQVNRGKSGDIQTIDFNSLAVNDILSFITNSVDENLSKFDRGNLDFVDSIYYNFEPDIEMRNKGIIAAIPLGLSLKNSYFANLGPKVPVKLQHIGSVSTNLNTVVKDYGINNALITLSVHISVSECLYLPFVSKKIVVDNDIPISIKIIQGTVPNYYGGVFSKSSPILSTNIDNT